MQSQSARQIVANARLGGFHFLLLGWCAFIVLFDGYDLVVFGALVPTLMNEWHLSAVQMGTLGSMALVGMLIGALVMGPLADRKGRRFVLLICTVLFSVMSCLSAFAPNALVFGALRLFTGIGLGGAIPNAVALTDELSPGNHRGIMVTAVMAFYAVGGMLSATVAMFVIPQVGWRPTLYFAAIPLIALPLMFRTLPESVSFLLLAGRLDAAVKTIRRIDPSSRFDPPITSTTAMAAHPGGAIPVVALFGDGRLRRTLLTWLVSAMCMLLVYGLNTWLPRLMVSGGYPLVSSLSFLMLLNAGAVVGGLFGGWLSDRFGTRETLIVFFIGAAVSLAALGTKPTPTLLSILLLVAGASTIGALSIFASFVAQAYPVEIRSTAVSYSSAAGRFGAMAGPLLGGLILGMGLPFFQNFLAFAAPALLGAIALVALGKTTAGDPSTSAGFKVLKANTVSDRLNPITDFVDVSRTSEKQNHADLK